MPGMTKLSTSVCCLITSCAQHLQAQAVPTDLTASPSAGASSICLATLRLAISPKTVSHDGHQTSPLIKTEKLTSQPPPPLLQSHTLVTGVLGTSAGNTNMTYLMASSPSAGSSNFWLVTLYIRFPRRCLMMLKVIFLPSEPPEAVRSTAWVAKLWKVVMLRIMPTDCSGMRHGPSMT